MKRRSSLQRFKDKFRQDFVFVYAAGNVTKKDWISFELCGMI